MLAVCPAAATSAKVVVAVLPEMTLSFAYEVVVAPIPTRSLVVARVTAPTLLVVHPPPVDAPPTDTVPQVIFPCASVLSAWPPAQFAVGMTIEPVKRPLSTVSAVAKKLVDVALVVVLKSATLPVEVELPNVALVPVRLVPERLVANAAVEVL